MKLQNLFEERLSDIHLRISINFDNVVKLERTPTSEEIIQLRAALKKMGEKKLINLELEKFNVVNKQHNFTFQIKKSFDFNEFTMDFFDCVIDVFGPIPCFSQNARNFIDFYKMPNEMYRIPATWNTKLHSCHQFKSLCGIHKVIDTRNLGIYNADMFNEGGLGLLLMKNLQSPVQFSSTNLSSEPPEWLRIILDAVLTEADILECKAELIEHGYSQHAKL